VIFLARRIGTPLVLAMEFHPKQLSSTTGGSGLALQHNRQSVNGQEERIDENENTLIAGVASSFIEALRADRFPLSNEQMGQL
jgi:hypothetical protein